MDGLKVYYSQLFGDFEKLNNLCSLNPEVINNSAIYQIVSSKYNKATKLGIDFYIDIFLDSLPFLIVVSLKSTHLSSFALYLNNSTSTCCINLSFPLVVI